MINISIQQLTEITNENSASAEEMSVSAKELSAQVEQLKNLIYILETRDTKDEKFKIKQKVKQKK